MSRCAVVTCDAEMSRYDFDYEQTTDGRYERRPYAPYLMRDGRSAAAALPDGLRPSGLAIVAALTPLLTCRRL